MIKMKLEQGNSQVNLFLPVSNVMLAEVIDETRQLSRRFPEILGRIIKDQDRATLAKKGLRCEQQAWIRRQTQPLPGIDIVVSPQVVAGALQQGWPRMDPETALVFGHGSDTVAVSAGGSG